MINAIQIKTGRVYPMSSQEELLGFVDSVLETLESEGIIPEIPPTLEILNQALRYSKGSRIYAVSLDNIQGFLMLSFYICSMKAKGILKQGSMLGYAYNIIYPDLSELGYLYLEKKADAFYRVG